MADRHNSDGEALRRARHRAQHAMAAIGSTGTFADAVVAALAPFLKPSL